MAPGSNVVISLPAVAVKGCMMSAVVDSDQPLLLTQPRFDEGSRAIVGYEEQASIADRTVGIESSSQNNECMLSASPCGPDESLTMNCSAGTDISDDLQGRLAESGDSSTHISISSVDKLNEDSTATLDKVPSSSGCTDSNLLDSNAVVQTGINTADVALASSLQSEAEGISAANVSLSDCQATEHEPVVSSTECPSAALLDTMSVPRSRHDRHSVSSISSDTCASSISLGVRTGSDILPILGSISHSSEKLWSWPNRRERVGFDSAAVGVVRSSWSQENYFDDSDVTCVDIDLDDDDDLASSVDALHYHDTALAGDTHPHCWTEDDVREADSLGTGKLRSWAPLKGDEVFEELFESSHSDGNYSPAHVQPAASDFRKRAAKTYGVGIAIDFDPCEDSSNTATSLSAATDSQHLTNWNSPNSPTSSSSDNFDDLSDDVICFPSSLFSDIATRPSSKDVDRPSAARLAKRLYYLQGFRKSDISRHLTKKNSFSQLVGEEFLKFFDFSGDSLDMALRRFVRHLTAATEPQDYDQLLSHFAQRYHSCNSTDQFTSADCCQKLSCALLILSSELNSQNLGQKTTLSEFISSLASVNDGENFPSDKLRELYDAVVTSPLQFEAVDSGDGATFTGTAASSASASYTVMTAGQVKYAPGSMANSDPLLQAPDMSSVAEFKKGFIMRKCCVDPDGRKTAVGRRGWKMFYAALCDMTLYMYSDENSYKRSTHCANVIHLHHSLAAKAGDYVKKNHVFRLQTADMAQYLIQTSDMRECQEWIDTINFVAASYSAPCQLDVAEQKRFQRPLLPSCCTTLNLREQISHQEKMVAHFEHELLEHRKDPPEKGARSRLIQEYCKKESYFKSEVKRYKTYVRLLQYKLAAFAELEPSLAETTIGEVDEPATSPEHETSDSDVKFVTTAMPPLTTAGIDISAVMTDVDRAQRQMDVGVSSGLGTLHEM